MELKAKLLGAVPVLQSSDDPTEVSRTITSALPAIVFFLGLLKIDITQVDLTSYAMALGFLIAGGRTIYFGILRFINWYKQR